MTTIAPARALWFVPANPAGYAREERPTVAFSAPTPSTKAEILARLHCYALIPAALEGPASLRFPHHKADGTLVWRGVAEAMAELLSEHAKLEPAAAREAYEHLADHYREFGKRPPEPPMRWKSAPVGAMLEVGFEVKDVNRRARTFRGLAATWNLDLGGDVIHKGAFAGTIRDWKKSGKAHPLLDSHNPFTIFSALGKLEGADETKAGVEGEWSLIGGPDGERTLDRLESGVVDSMSIGYRPTTFDFEEADAKDFSIVRNIRELSWRETSLVVFPMNPAAEIDVASIKAAVESVYGVDRATLVAMHGELGRLLEAGAPPAEKPKAVDEPTEDLSYNRLARLRVQRLTSSKF